MISRASVCPFSPSPALGDNTTREDILDYRATRPKLLLAVTKCVFTAVTTVNLAAVSHRMRGEGMGRAHDVQRAWEKLLEQALPP